MNVFLEETPNAPRPANSQSREWVGFGVGEAGQLKLSNGDKAKAKQVLHICEDDYDAAIKAAQHKAKPWYRRILGAADTGPDPLRVVRIAKG